MDTKRFDHYMESEVPTSTAVRRTLNCSIDFRYYQRRAHCQRSSKAWDIIHYMSQILPFHRYSEASPSLGNSDCTMMR